MKFNPELYITHSNTLMVGVEALPIPQLSDEITMFNKEIVYINIG